jgi:pilus assembly protein CpaF
MLLQKLLSDESIEDILLSPKGLSYFAKGTWTGPEADVSCDNKNLFSLARRIAERSHLTLGLTQPSVDSFVDFQGEHLFRAHVVIAPMVLVGPEITLRRLPKTHRFNIESFSSNEQDISKLQNAIHSRKSILIAGSTGAGKSSLLTACLNELPQNERVLILEDSPELPIPNALSSKLIARNDRFGFREGSEWNLCHLVFESLRMRPSRIVVGECRGPEARAISQALMTGHRGLWTTLHAGSCAQALERFSELVKAEKSLVNFDSQKYWDLIVHIDCNEKGERQIKELFNASSD